MVRHSPDVIVAQNTTATLAAKSATQTIPIVAGVLIDPVNFGLVESHARPGGNVTGLLSSVEGLSGKQLQLASEIVPGATKIGLLFNADNRGNDPQRKEIEIAATARGIELQLAEIRRAADLQPAFQVLASNGVQVVVVVRDTLAFSERQYVAVLAATSRLPTVFGWRQGPEAGGLASYGIRTLDNYRRAAVFVDKILKGAKASDLPLEFATKLELVINLKTARALGLTIPPSLLARADEVIE
jgi:putative ABC transport system substrate-binding protein